MAITGPQFQAHAPPVVQAQVLQKPGNVYNGMFAQLLGNTLGTGFEHLMRGFFPTPQDEEIKVRTDAERQKIEKDDFEKASWLKKRIESDPQNASYYQAQLDKIHARQGTTNEQIGITPEIANEYAAFDSYKKTGDEAKQFLSGSPTTPQVPVPQQPVQPNPPATGAPIEAPAGYVSSGNDVQSPQLPVSQPPYPSNFVGPTQEQAVPPQTSVQQSSARIQRMDPATDKQNEIAIGFSHPQPQPLSQTDQLKRAWAQRQLLASAEAMRMINARQGQNLFATENKELLQTFDHSVQAYGQLYRSMMKKEYGVQEDYVGLVGDDTIRTFALARIATLSGAKNADMLNQQAQRRRDSLMNDPMVAGDPEKQANLQKYLLDATNGYLQFAQAAQVPAAVADTYANMQDRRNRTTADIGYINQQKANLKVDLQLNQLKVNTFVARSDAEIKQINAQVDQAEALTGVYFSEAAKNRLLLSTSEQMNDVERVQKLASAYNYVTTKDPSVAQAMQTINMVKPSFDATMKELQAVDKALAPFRGQEPDPKDVVRYQMWNELTTQKSSLQSALLEYKDTMSAARGAIVGSGNADARTAAAQYILNQFPSLDLNTGNVRNYPGTKIPINDTLVDPMKTQIASEQKAGRRIPLSEQEWLQRVAPILVKNGDVPNDPNVLKYVYNQYSTNPAWQMKGK